jgi:flagellar basal-body rod modification protein FlgD
MQNTSAVGSSTSAQTGSTSTSASKEMGKDQFLKLLMAQLKNQDPLKPMETTEFSSQLAQFSSIEQLINIKDILTTSTESNKVLTETIFNSLATNMIGKEIKAVSNETKFDGKTPVKFGFEYPSDASTLKISITDATGKVVKTYDRSWSSGDNTIEWDGLDNSGNLVQSGKYTVAIDAKDKDGNAISVSPYTFGKISAIRYRDGESYVVVNGVEINLKNLKEIYGGS